MSSRDFAVPARYYVRFGELLAQMNVDVPALFARARISARAMEEPDAQVRFSQVEKLVELATEASGRSDLGIELGRTLTASTHSIVGFGMLNSPNVERSLQFVARFFRLVMPSFSMRYTKRPAGAEMSWSPAVGMSGPCLSFHIEAIATAAYRELQELSGGRLPLFHAELSIPEPLHRERYRQQRGAHWSFSAGERPGVLMRFDYDVSHYPVVAADPNALRVAEERCRALVSQVAAKGSFKEWTAMMLREAGDGLPGITDLAAVLNLSSRTLDRYLKSEGTGFRELSAQVQHELACERLEQGTYSITAVAQSLGFRDVANFTRAFRNRAGCSPSAFREKLGR